MTDKPVDIKVLNKIINRCRKKLAIDENDSKVKELYNLACKAKLDLLGRTLNKQEDYDKDGNKIIDLAKKIAIYSEFDEIIDEISVPASTSPVHEYSGDDIKLSAEGIRKLNIKMGQSTEAIDRKRAAAGLPTNYNYER